MGMESMTIQDKLEDTKILAGLKDLRMVVRVQVGDKSITFLPRVEILVETNQKGIHMSRLIESTLIGWLETEKDMKIEELGLNIMKYILKRKKLIGINDDKIVVHCEGEYIYELTEPCTVIIHTTKNGKDITNIVGIKIRCLSTCPCSLIESGGKYAHSQGVDITVMKRDAKVEELIEKVEKEITPTRTLLKRDEEVELIRKSFENPLFVEDIVRKLSRHFDYVRAESHESIHKFMAIAEYGDYDRHI